MKSKYIFVLLVSILFSCNTKTDNQQTTSYQPEKYEFITQDLLTEMMLVKGELVYVPVYSEIFHTDVKRKVKLSATLSIRNTSTDSEIVVSTVDYYDTHGKLLKHYLTSPLQLKPLQTKIYVVEYKENEGGIGANFIVEWAAQKEVPEPIIQAVMIGGSSSLGISFVCDGKVIEYINE
jgi:hypothetical protein